MFVINYFLSKESFFLPFNVKIHLFKVFILPHFDYGSSLIIYFTDSMINQIEEIFNYCVFMLFNIQLKIKTLL